MAQNPAPSIYRSWCHTFAYLAAMATSCIAGNSAKPFFNYTNNIRLAAVVVGGLALLNGAFFIGLTMAQSDQHRGDVSGQNEGVYQTLGDTAASIPSAPPPGL